MTAAAPTVEKKGAKISWFSRFARQAARAAFSGATILTVVWLATGWLAHFSDTWQLVMNTISSVVTFLVVFVIQNTQARDTAALLIKLDELLRATPGARLGLLDLETRDEPSLERLLEHYERLAREARERLDRGELSTRAAHGDDRLARPLRR